MAIEDDLYLANAIMLQALVAIEEVMGKKGLDAVLRASKLDQYIENPPPDNLEPSISYADYGRLNQAIEEFYGRGGKGILKRIGRESFKYGVREQAALLGIAGVALKLLPKRKRINFIFNALGNALVKANPGSEFWVDSRGNNIAYLARTCSICHRRESEGPVCHLFVGSLSEAAKWATGEEMLIRETHCKAKGDPYCRYEVIME